MTGAICALLILFFQFPGGPTAPNKLVDQLGSMKYADRQAAAEALERLGPGALPALRHGRESKDLEIRTRSASLLRKIEGAMLTRPTLLKLDFKEVPLSEVIKSLGEQAGLKIAVFPDSVPRLKTQKVTLQAAEPVSFWTGIDLLCSTAQLRPNPGMVGPGSGREPSFALVAGSNQPILPSWDHGPFRVSLTRLHSERDVSFGPTAPAFPRPLPNRPAPVEPAVPAGAASPKPLPVLSVQFNFQLQVTAEPRLSLGQGGNVQLTEAVDDLGSSLVAGSVNDQRPVASRFSRQFTSLASQQLQLVVPLRRPESPGTTIKILKGVIPVIVSARRAEPLVVPLADASGKTFENGEITVVVHGIRKNPGNTQTSIELTVRPVSGDLPVDPQAMADPFASRAEAPQQQIDVVDSQGRVLPWYQSSIDPESSRMTMTLSQFGPGIEPKEIRIHSLTRASTNVPFEFRDLPMP